MIIIIIIIIIILLLLLLLLFPHVLLDFIDGMFNLTSNLKNCNSCYWSRARCQIFLCLERHTNEAKGSVQCGIDPFALFACQTTDNCDKSYYNEHIKLSKEYSNSFSVRLACLSFLF